MAASVPKKKKHFYILLNGKCVGESWAVSDRKAVTNWWWKNVKYESALSPRDYSPSDFEAVEERR